jgi:type I restriction enzyme S subunit
MPRFTYLLGLVSPGGAGRNRVLNKGDFLNLEVPAPDLGKQEMIAACLGAAEDAIVNATEYREALTRQKRGLMQKLLTGEWRVKVEG